MNRKEWIEYFEAINNRKAHYSGVSAGPSKW